ncbi:hypothetical protein Tsubulata_004771 [Turnera subulata]|uniref:DUF3615 domain-containing protein n=1 Tax=Turnera subulata TaxID=218843 RepID=A0A9Q0F9U4_9ROSI|nr:hypothetical protein Tsubulata_004771 [Turnera subulata]
MKRPGQVPAPASGRARSPYNLRSLKPKGADFKRPLNSKGADLQSPQNPEMAPEDRERLRKKAIEYLRTQRGLIKDPSGLLKHDDPELKDMDGIRDYGDGFVYRLTPSIIRSLARVPPEEVAEKYQKMFEFCRPYANIALEWYQRQNGTSFELLEVVGALARVCFGGGVWHIKFTAKPANGGSQANDGAQAGSSTTTTTFFAEVHITGRLGKHVSQCFTIDSILNGDPDDPGFKIVKKKKFGVKKKKFSVKKKKFGGEWVKIVKNKRFGGDWSIVTGVSAAKEKRPQSHPVAWKALSPVEALGFLRSTSSVSS